MPKLFFLYLALTLASISHSQYRIEFRVCDNFSKQELPGATISIKNRATKITDTTGYALFNVVAGTYSITISHTSYFDTSFVLSINNDSKHEIFLSPEEKEMDDVVVQSARNGQLASTSPIKVDVLGQEEMEEENTIKPANIASIIGDLSSVQIQQSSSITGNSNVRIQGLDGRYTLMLRDGMPLYDGLSGGFGILSMPPLDLEQVELVKGPASTLYGGGAISGLINVISKKPKKEQDIITTLNHTTLNENNANLFVSKRYEKIGYTFFAGINKQAWKDINGDGFSEVPQVGSINFHPRLFIYPSASQTLILDYATVIEHRLGGDVFVLNNTNEPSHPYFEKINSLRNTAQVFYTKNFLKNRRLEVKAGSSMFNWNQKDNTAQFAASQRNYYSEASLLIPYGHAKFVCGMNMLGDMFKKNKSVNAFLSDFSNTTLGFYGQNSWFINNNNTILETGLRYDIHNTYGNFLLPRISIFHKMAKLWSIRSGIGWGYKPPNPLAVQNKDVALNLIRPIPVGAMAENSIGSNFDVTFHKKGSGIDIMCTQSIFVTSIRHPLAAITGADNTITYINMAGQVLSYGLDTYIKAVVEETEFYAGYTYTFAKRNYIAVNSFMPLTPRNRWAFTFVKNWEIAGVRIGLEGSYNGVQLRSDATKTPHYFFAAAMVDKKLTSHIHVILNGENILNFKQSKVEPLVEGSFLHPYFRELWAPVEGRVINMAMRYKFHT